MPARGTHTHPSRVSSAIARIWVAEGFHSGRTRPSCKAGFYHGLRGAMADPRAISLIERYAYFWQAVGQVAGALMRQKTLTGAKVEALVRIAQDQGQHAPRGEPKTP